MASRCQKRLDTAHGHANSSSKWSSNSSRWGGSGPTRRSGRIHTRTSIKRSFPPQKSSIPPSSSTFGVLNSLNTQPSHSHTSLVKMPRESTETVGVEVLEEVNSVPQPCDICMRAPDFNQILRCEMKKRK